MRGPQKHEKGGEALWSEPIVYLILPNCSLFNPDFEFSYRMGLLDKEQYEISTTFVFRRVFSSLIFYPITSNRAGSKV